MTPAAALQDHSHGQSCPQATPFFPVDPDIMIRSPQTQEWAGYHTPARPGVMDRALGGQGYNTGELPVVIELVDR